METALAGGQGRCGGGDGGASVPASGTVDATHAGQSGGSGVSGGSGGPTGGVLGGRGGGGGGGYVLASIPTNPAAGLNPDGGAGGGAGTIFRDDAFAILTGSGSGGGGGSGYDDLSDVPSHSSGGSGGAGGGSIQIYAVEDVTVTATGSLNSSGGDGGSVGGGLKGGAGGGGAGGSILIFAGNDITFGGAVQAVAGSGGTTAGGAGGRGSWGRTWIVEKGGFPSGTIEDPQSQLIQPGIVVYETGVTYTVTSVGLDLGNSEPTLQTAPITILNQGASTVSYELAFSDSSSLSSLSGFNLSSTYIGNKVSRFVRYRIQFDNLSATTPTKIDDLSFTFDGFEQTEFDFTTGCGRVAAIGLGARIGFALFFLLMPLLLVGILRLHTHHCQLK